MAVKRVPTTTKVISMLNERGLLEPVLDKDLSTPPSSPSTGDRYIVGADATGDWAGHDNEIAEWNGSSWDFGPTLAEGLVVYVKDENDLYAYDGSSWIKPYGEGTGTGDMLKSVYDTDDDGIVDKAESIDDGAGNTATAAEIKSTVDKAHDQNTDTILKTEGTEQLDQQQTFKSDEIYISDFYRGQTFTPSISGELTKVTLSLAKVGTPSDNLIVEIRSVSEGTPTSTVLSSVEIAASSIPDYPEQDVDIVFSTPANLTAGTKYAIVFYQKDLNGDLSNGYVTHYIDSDAYEGGQRVDSSDNVSWTTYNHDYYFKAYVTPPDVALIDSGVLKTNLSADDGVTIDGRDISVDGAKLDTIEENAVSLSTVKSDADIADAITKKHVQNTDTYLDQGGSNEVSASEIRTALDTTIPGKADKVSGATDGNLASLDANGNLQDAGIAASNVFDKSADDLDDIGDGSTYGKVKLSELNNGTVTQLNDGTNTVTAAQGKKAYDTRAQYDASTDEIVFVDPDSYSG